MTFVYHVKRIASITFVLILLKIIYLICWTKDLDWKNVFKEFFIWNGFVQHLCLKIHYAYNGKIQHARPLLFRWNHEKHKFEIFQEYRKVYLLFKVFVSVKTNYRNICILHQFWVKLHPSHCYLTLNTNAVFWRNLHQMQYILCQTSDKLYQLTSSPAQPPIAAFSWPILLSLTITQSWM